MAQALAMQLLKIDALSARAQVWYAVRFRNGAVRGVGVIGNQQYLKRMIWG